MLFAILIFLTTVIAKQVDVYWNITYFTCNRDGHFTRRCTGVNGTLPIPPIHINRGDTLALHVHNQLTEPTSLHCHGIFFRGQNYLDGAGNITQCGIPPGSHFTYETTITEQQGTYWVHSHFNHQNADGLRTPLIIHDPQDPYQYDEDLLITLEDWYPEPFMQHLNKIVGPGIPFPPPQSTFPYGLVNGYNGNLSQSIQFRPNRKYRIRVINMSITEWFKFSLPGHHMQVIEMEGVYCAPYPADGLDLGPAQRMSVLVESHDTDQFNYIYNSTLYASFVPTLQGKNPRYYQGLIEYRRGAPLRRISRPSDSKLRWSDDIHMQPLLPIDQQPPLPANRTIELAIQLKIDKEGIPHTYLGKRPFVHPLIPSLYTALSTGQLAMEPEVYGNQTSAQLVRHGQAYEILINNASPFDHVMHLHGHNFQVIEYGPFTLSNQTINPLTNETIARRPVARYTGRWPMRRDSVTLLSYQYVRIRYLADNPGVWLFHCHMDVHFAMGMGVLFVEEPQQLQTLQVPQQMYQMCQAQNIPIRGNAAGNPGLNMTGLPLLPQF